MSQFTREEQALMAAIGYDFEGQRALLLEAITHRSYANEAKEPHVGDNERLEFLGDAVIDLVVASELMKRFPEASEGELSKLRASIVSEIGLCALADRIQLGKVLRLGKGEEATGGREKASILSDAFEALFAAIYVSGGYEKASELFLKLLNMKGPIQKRQEDAKSRLQHRVQASHHVTPSYAIQSEEGPDHDKRFVVKVEVSGLGDALGEGRSKKEAEQAAARHFLATLEAESTGESDGEV